mmetsp:Transcript_6908/g.19352  ORF Transcript_6908/g.19352 Transcript_6908/m.19352 type:complete len:1330 (+) Transcript_6908:188-4177(+)
MYSSFPTPPEPYGQVPGVAANMQSEPKPSPPLPPPPPPPAAAASSPSPTVTQRRSYVAATPAQTSSPYMTAKTTSSPYGAAPNAGYASDTSYASSTYEFSAPSTANMQPRNNAKQPPKKNSLYPHNPIIASFWIPSLWCTMQGFESSTPLTTLLCVALALYALDLANLRQPFFFGLWFSVIVMAMVTGWCILIEDEDADGAGGGPMVLFYLVQIAVNTLLFVCGACWLTLQQEWLSSTTMRNLEETLHAILPMVASGICTVRVGVLLAEEFGRDVSAILAPYVFALFQTLAMLTLGCAKARAQDGTTPIRNGTTSKEEKPAEDAKSNTKFIISSPIAFGHTAVLLVAPIAMHLLTCLGRILSFYASTDDLYDLVLVVCAPYLLQYSITWLHETKTWASPYSSPKLGSSLTLSGVLRPTVVSLVASLAVQQRYLIALSHACSYQFMGTKTPAWLISIYLVGATVSLIFTVAVWGRVSSVTNEPLFGEYHEDVVQLGLSLTGMLLGKGVGLPWNFTPLPVLAFLGLSLWFTTRMLRYLSIFLFVVHATGVVVFTYRFAGIEDSVVLPIGLKLNLIRFALAVVFCSILIGLVTGISVRSGGGFGSKWTKRLDLGGVAFIAYTILLTGLEIALLKRPVPVSELVGVLSDEAEADDMLYDPVWAYITSALIIGVSVFMHRVKIIFGKTFGVVVSLAVGKAVAIYIDAVGLEEGTDDANSTGKSVLLRTLVAGLLCLMMCYPRFVLTPVHVKTGAIYRRSLSNGRGNTQLPPGTGRIAMAYVFAVLPVALLLSLQYVLMPFAHAIRSDFQGSPFYGMDSPISEVVGFALILWGVASLFMLNYYLPDGGGEVWKKLAALGFLTGVGICFAAPTLGFSGYAASNPYAAISSVGTKVVNRGKSRTGGWGIVAAGIATLLALTGPLELKERQTDSVRRDKFLLFRTMIFSLLFGGGIAWFIIMQSMSEAPWLVLLLTGLSCLAISFLGTVAAVLGYFIELEDMQEVEQIFTIWLIALPIFLPVTGLPQFLNIDASHPFGVGGWLSTYLVICSAASFAFALALRSRPTKNSLTRGLANLSVLLAWLFGICMLYGRYGVAGLDENYDVTHVLGLPASIVGTLAMSLFLLALEGESSGPDRSRMKRVSSHSTKPTKSLVGVTFANLTSSNWWVPPVAGTAAVFVVASLFAILLRGAGFLSIFGAGDVARSHEDVFSNVFGDKKTHDLATLAEKAVSHVKALATSAKLAGAGFWTAKDWLGPILHLVGITAVLPSLFLLVAQGWSPTSSLSSFVPLCIPLNLIPMVLSRGIPSLLAGAALGLVGGLVQVVTNRSAAHNSKMRI